MSTPYPMSKATRMEAKDNLVKWLEKGIWAERWEAYQESFLDKICHLLEMDVADFMEKNKGGNLEYQIFNAMIEDFFQLEFDQPPHNVVDDYLKRRGWKESRRDRIYIEGLRTVPFSIYAVEDVEPGQWVKVQDKILSSPIMKIQEIRGSQQINVMDYLIAKVIPYEDEFVFSGCLFLLSESVAEARAKEIRQVLEQRGFSLSQNNLKQTEQWSDIHQILNSYALRLYSDGFSKMLAPPPNLVNAEGHPLLFVETTIPVLDESRVIQFLDNDPEFNRIESDDNSIVFWDWLLLDESLTKQAESADDNSRQILTMNDEMKPVRGTLELTDEGLFCSVNAKERWDILLPKLQRL